MPVRLDYWVENRLIKLANPVQIPGGTKILKKCRKHLHKLKKKHFDGNFVRFCRRFLEELKKNCTKISNNFKEKLRRNPEEI